MANAWNRRSVLRGLAGLGTAALLRPASSASPASTSGRPIDLRLWAMGREGEVLPHLLEAFHLEQGAVRVRVEALPWSSAHEKLLTAFAGDALPDLAQIGNSWLPEMVALGAVRRLDEASDLAAQRADHFPGIWATNQLQGGLWGMPWYVDTRVLFYRRDLLAQAGYIEVPSTWAGWRDSLLRLQAGGLPHPVLLPGTEYEPLLVLALQHEEPLLDPLSLQPNFRGPGFRAALRFYLELHQRGLAPKASQNQIANLWQEFDRGHIAFYMSGPWNLGEFARRIPAERQGIWSTASVPGPQGPGHSIAGGSSLALFKRSRHPEAAAQVLAYLSRPEVQARLYQLTGNLPARRSAWAALPADPRRDAFAQQLERLRPTPAVPEWERIAQEMQLTASRLAYQGGDADEALAALDQRVSAILAKRRWVLQRQRRQS